MYLTLWSLNARNSSLRSPGIIGRGSVEGCGESVGGCAGFPDRGEPVTDGKALPVTVVFGLLLFGIGDSANCLVRGHRSRSFKRPDACGSSVSVLGCTELSLPNQAAPGGQWNGREEFEEGLMLEGAGGTKTGADLVEQIGRASCRERVFITV